MSKRRKTRKILTLGDAKKFRKGEKQRGNNRAAGGLQLFVGPWRVELWRLTDGIIVQLYRKGRADPLQADVLLITKEEGWPKVGPAWFDYAKLGRGFEYGEEFRPVWKAAIRKINSLMKKEIRTAIRHKALGIKRPERNSVSWWRSGSAFW